MRKVIYIAGPYRGSTPEKIQQNIHSARTVAAKAAGHGLYVVIPHNMSSGIEMVAPEAYWLAATMELMRRCDAVLLCPGWVESKGTMAEIDEAHRLGIPVYETLADLLHCNEDSNV